ncbi:hypothetical protein SCRES2_gp4 [Synechococcus phage S-CRES2]|nr:hypothetical protein SCRES2_gp4 [Synechococcus phage S-CRES2]
MDKVSTKVDLLSTELVDKVSTKSGQGVHKSGQGVHHTIF